jgi:hypothetical protein
VLSFADLTRHLHLCVRQYGYILDLPFCWFIALYDISIDGYYCFLLTVRF